MVQTFYAKLESVLQSSKFENLMLNEPFDLKIKLLGRQHMKELRQKQGDILKNLNIKNFGLFNLFEASQKKIQLQKQEKKYFFEVPTISGAHHTEMQDCFSSNCLIMSIIIGRWYFFI